MPDPGANHSDCLVALGEAEREIERWQACHDRAMEAIAEYRNQRRFEAACAALAGMLPAIEPGSQMGSRHAVAAIAVEYADSLLKALEPEASA